MGKKKDSDSAFVWNMVIELQKYDLTPPDIVALNRLRRIASRLSALEQLEKRTSQIACQPNWHPTASSA